MYGKHFASMYTGSMYGAGPEVFAVWGWVIANADEGRVEINPDYLAAVIGMSVESVVNTVNLLCQPDPKSRTLAHEGRRLVPISGFLYEVPSHQFYRNLKTNEDRRTYMRKYMRERRDSVNKKVNTDLPLAVLGQAEAEADTEENTTAKLVSKTDTGKSRKGTRIPADFHVTEEHRTWAWSKSLPAPDEHIEEFLDYWRSKPGAGGVKLDWDATFRNWLRNARPKTKANGNGNHADSGYRTVKNPTTGELFKVKNA